jgi:hypothetical protein
MDTQITLLSDDALDAVSGGRPNIISEGHVAIAGSSLATGTQIIGGGKSVNGPNLFDEFLVGAAIVGAIGLAAAAAA